ncbi:HK97 gp10 family phage protein [Burkholderia vietnamiensis]|uniref:HK97 gp10 family phage protein n=1 Tax=Burkholderia vietnamiensis TaxID=60552 RepID=UPI000841A8BB|nr:HK97 gp10 family phage protein [Burkholderia vietnamiensis]AOK40836.1 hypothetical protein WL96_07150 [Burkholderia vietnamiensis]
MANKPGISYHLEGFEGFDKRIDFDKKKIRAAMRKAGRIVRNRARDGLSKGSSSGAGYPRVRKGTLRNSIGIKVSRSGFLVRVRPEKTSGMGQHYYPAYLHYGVRAKNGSARGKPGGWRIAPRENYMADALQQSAAEIESVLRSAFAAALDIK